MQLINNTPLVAGCTLGMAPDGQELLVVAVKGSFSIPHRSDSSPVLLEQQLPLLDSDTFSGEPGLSSPLFESDYAPFKSRCDITVVGSAYAPDGKPAARVQTGFQVARIGKLVDVLGNRHWLASAEGVSISPAEPFEVRAITYDIAFGGTDRGHEDERVHAACLANPVGIGFHKGIHDSLVNGSPAPSTEEPGNPVTHPNALARPMSLGPMGRSWTPRIDYGGTYDDDWLDERFPFLPEDFDTRYYQSAPEDQQSPYLQGGEEVRLFNLTPNGRCQFQIPQVDVPICFFKRKARRHEVKAVVDTLIIEPDRQRFSLVWRARLPLSRNLFEVPEVLVGSASRGWWRSRASGKRYHPSLAELVPHQTSESDTQ